MEYLQSILEAGHPISGCPQGHTALKVPGKKHPPTSIPPSGCSWLLEAETRQSPVCAPVFKFPIFVRTPVLLDEGPALLLWDLILTTYVCSDPFSKEEHAEVFGG